jgi:hypothetical protein
VRAGGDIGGVGGRVGSGTVTQAPLPDLLAARPGASLEDIYLELTGTSEGEPA